MVFRPYRESTNPKFILGGAPMNKKKLFLTLHLAFTVLTFAGAIYVIVTKSNAGFSVVPMLFSLVFSHLYRQEMK
jgi:hypothetical protein